MAFSTYSDVRSVCDTNLSDAAITNVITWVDAMIKLKINTASPPSGSGLSAAEWAAFLEGLSAMWAAYTCYKKDPDAERLGEYQGSKAVVLRLAREDILSMLKMGGGGIAMQYHSESLPRW